MDGSIELTMLHRPAVNVHARVSRTWGSAGTRGVGGERDSMERGTGATGWHGRQEGEYGICVHRRDHLRVKLSSCAKVDTNRFTRTVSRPGINACVCSVHSAAGSLSGA